MKNKKIIIFVVIIVIIFLSQFAYVEIGKRRLYTKTFDYLTIDKGYKKEEFEITNPRHSFLNRILSYAEWGIDVVFKDDPNARYIYTFDPNDNDTITQNGVSGPSKSKKHFEYD